MISFIEFFNRAKATNPPLVSEYKRRFRLSALQGVGLCLLIFFSILIPALIYGCLEEKECKVFSEDSIGGFLAFLIVYIGGWAGFIYSLKHFPKQKREEFVYKSPTRILDACVVILGIIILCFIFNLDLPQKNDDLNPIQNLLLFAELGIVILYFNNPKRKKRVAQGYQAIPLYQLLNLLGVQQDELAPDFLTLTAEKKLIRFGYQNLTGKFGHHEENRFGLNSYPSADIYEGIVFEYSDPEIMDEYSLDNLKNTFQNFILSFTGKDLFFHRDIIEIKSEKTQQGVYVFYFITYHGNGARMPNLYIDKYFRYSSDDLKVIYKDVQDLFDTLKK